jgi:hypothetical protein
MLHKINRSIRVPKSLRSRFKQSIVRLTINPGLYLRSEHLVRWNRESVGKLSAIQVVHRARRRYPTLTWSDSVENYLVDLLEQAVKKPAVLTTEEKRLIARFAPLSPVQKIRFMQKKIRLYRYLKNLTNES